MAVDPAGDAPRQKWSLTQEAFDRLLASLGPDRDAAADRYLEIRRNLVRLFEWRGCPAPDEYADETMNRCARKIADGEEIRDVATYAIGVARMLVLESARGRAREARPLDSVPEPHVLPDPLENDRQPRTECLTRCLSYLSAEDRDLILNYYQGEKSEKIKTRKGLTLRLGIGASALRMRALRLRERLQLCTENCLQQAGGGRL
jgi:DNA-directed RNA polymerase specialized sigma24 family protein